MSAHARPYARPSDLRSALAATLLAATGCSHGHAFGAAENDAVVAVLEAQRDAWNRGDLDGYMAGYEHSPELVFTSGGNIRRGWEETRTKYEARYGADPATMGRLEFEIDEVRGLSDRSAVVLGHWRLTETPQAGGGVFSVVLVRSDAGWRVVHDHTSASEDESVSSAPADDLGDEPLDG
jgi:uncharacterized protein (TIGR02246 family)